MAGLPKKYRVAVVAISSAPQVVSAPTADRAFVTQAINDLRIGQGTAIGDGLANAIQVATGVPPGKKPPVGSKRIPSAVLVISDGAQDGGLITIPQAIARARAAKVPVFTALLGTAKGVVNVPLVGGFNEQIRVPTDPSALQNIASQTGGKYYAAPTQAQLAVVYKDLKSRLGSTDKDEEITVAFAALGAVLLVAGQHALGALVPEDPVIRAAALTVALVAALLVSATPSGAADADECKGLRTCIPVIGPWVAIPAHREASRRRRAGSSSARRASSEASTRV